MSRIVHISDLHFGTTTPQMVSALLGRIAGHAPDLVAVSGDLTQRARHREFVQASRFLDQLNSPCLVVPGNHDLPLWRPLSRFARPWKLWDRYISDQSIPRLAGTDFVAAGINTARRWGSWIDWSHGRVNRQQLAAVARVFAETPRERLRLLVAHHPFVVDRARLSHGTVGRAEAGLVALIGADVDLILGGHLHQGYSAVSRVRGVSGPVVLQAGSATSSRLRGEANSYNVIDLAPGQMDIRVMGWANERFQPVKTFRYRKAGTDWVAQ